MGGCSLFRFRLTLQHNTSDLKPTQKNNENQLIIQLNSENSCLLLLFKALKSILIQKVSIERKGCFNYQRKF